MTIDELMEGKKPGEIRVKFAFRAGWFQPFYKDSESGWYGLDESGHSLCFVGATPGELYTEPKPKRILKEWLIRDKESQRWWVYDTLETEEGIQKFVRMRDYAEYRPAGREFEV